MYHIIIIDLSTVCTYIVLLNGYKKVKDAEGRGESRHRWKESQCGERQKMEKLLRWQVKLQTWGPAGLWRYGGKLQDHGDHRGEAHAQAGRSELIAIVNSPC